MRYNDIFILFTVILILLKYPSVILSEDLYYPRRVMPLSKNETGVVVLSFIEHGNYTHIVNADGFIFVVANGNAILKLDKNSWKVLSKYQFKGECVKEGLCESIKINLMQLYQKKNLLWFCFAHMSVENNIYRESSPLCNLADQDRDMAQKLGEWTGKVLTTSDFEHRTVLLSVSEYAYAGIHYFGDKSMHIFKNVVPYDGTSLQMKSIRLPLSYLKDPGEFMLTFQDKNSIYFLLLETDYSCGYYKNRLQTRLLRICHNDPGNMDNYFSILSKVNLNCKQHSSNANFPPYVFDVADSATWLPLNRLLVVSFSSKRNEAPSSVVCRYSIKAIEDAFDSDLKTGTQKPSYGKNTFKDSCNLQDSQLLDNTFISNIYTTSNKYPLRKKTLSSVQFYQEKYGKISYVSYDETSWSVDNRRVVLFLGVENTLQSSIVILSLEPIFCVFEKFMSPERITSMELLRDYTARLYIGTMTKIFFLAMDRCKDNSLEDCQSTSSLYCAWSSTSNRCQWRTPDIMAQMAPQSFPTCPAIPKYSKGQHANLPCPLFLATDPLKQIGACTCITSHHNKVSTTMVTSCKVDGGWSTFSEWSECSVTCDSGTQTRSRVCDHPLPQNGGLICKGEKQEFRLCQTKLECNKFNLVSQAAFLSKWSEWTSCSSTCGFGYRRRTRQCPSGTCVGDLYENKLCKLPFCQNSVLSEWSSWSVFNHTESSRKRLRIRCTDAFFYMPYYLKMKLLIGKNKTKNCISGQCFEKNPEKVAEGKWEQWSSWSGCSRSCVVDVASRSRQCLNGQCLGTPFEVKTCNTLPCVTTWGCWSNWIGCSSQCETQKNKVRKRICLKDKQGQECVGSTVEEKECSMMPCPSSYTPWSTWSSCTNDGVLTRNRKCKSERSCLFPLLQSKPCAQASTTAPAMHSSIYMIVSGLIGLLAGVFVGSAICYFWWRFTLSVIEKTNSESLRLPFNPMDPYCSQYLNSPIDGVSILQPQMSTSNNDIDYQSEYEAPYRDASDSSFSAVRPNFPFHNVT